MAKSNMSGIPSVDAMTDTFEFVKNIWGGMKMPGMVMPTLSVDEVNKQISDLKAVESWLTLNMNMLRGTIQALEVQSATLATLQSMSATMNSMVKPAAAEEKPAFEAPPSMAAVADPSNAQGSLNEPANMTVPFANPAAWWNMLQDQFKQAVNTAMTPETTSPAVKPQAAPRKRKSSPKS